MNFEKIFSEQLNKHPSMDSVDVIKLCYQAAFGAEHLVSDIVAAEELLKEEFENTKAEKTDLFEKISDDICRINISAWKYEKLPIGWLFKMFVASAKAINNGEERFKNYLDCAKCILLKEKSNLKFNEYLSEYLSMGIHAVHHSELYRRNEQPSYRVVKTEYIRLIPVLKAASRFINNEKVCVIAVDGRAASGKTTLAKLLETVLDADTIHMDDFFLPPSLRSNERLNTAGGNIHYERFLEEVIPYILIPDNFSYRIFDCSKMDYNGIKTVENKKFRIVEGSYSCHPVFKEYADITVFSDVDAEEQIKRIIKRNGKDMAAIFRDKWIPLEEKYFETYEIPEKCKIRL